MDIGLFPQNPDGGCTSRNSSVTFRARKAALCLPRLHLKYQSFNNFKSNKMKFSIKEAKFKLTGLSRLGTVLLFNSLDLKFLPRAFREMPLAYKELYPC